MLETSSLTVVKWCVGAHVTHDATRNCRWFMCVVMQESACAAGTCLSMYTRFQPAACHDADCGCGGACRVGSQLLAAAAVLQHS
jgi:hypothetical protein